MEKGGKLKHMNVSENPGIEKLCRLTKQSPHFNPWHLSYEKHVSVKR